MQMSVLSRFLLVSLCALCAAPAVSLELLAVGSHSPKIFERQANGEFSGLSVGVLRELLVPLGHQVRFRIYPWARAKQMVELGQADILIGPYKTPERETRFAFSAQPFYRDSIVFFQLNSHALQWQGDYQQLLGRRVGVVRAWTYGAVFDTQREQLELVTVENVKNGMRMLKVGRLDLLASNQRNKVPALEALESTDAVSQLSPEIGHQDGYFAFQRQAQADHLRTDMDRQFAIMVATGRLAALSAALQVDVP
jgi:polar amino acid transport system substrate-binding protein